MAVHWISTRRSHLLLDMIQQPSQQSLLSIQNIWRVSFVHPMPYELLKRRLLCNGLWQYVHSRVRARSMNLGQVHVHCRCVAFLWTRWPGCRNIPVIVIIEVESHTERRSRQEDERRRSRGERRELHLPWRLARLAHSWPLLGDFRSKRYVQLNVGRIFC